MQTPSSQLNLWKSKKCMTMKKKELLRISNKHSKIVGKECLNKLNILLILL
jgi:hypothetical protein